MGHMGLAPIPRAVQGHAENADESRDLSEAHSDCRCLSSVWRRVKTLGLRFSQAACTRCGAMG